MFISASIGLVGSSNLTPGKIIFKQLLTGLGVGGILFIAAIRINYKFWYRTSFIFFILASILMLLVLLPGLGFSHGGAQRWLDLGPISFQPAELLKFAFIIYLAAWLSARKKDVDTGKFGLLPFLAIMGFVSFLFLLQSDLGTLAVILASATLLFFIGGGRILHLVFAGLVVVLMLVLMISFEDYRKDRVMTFFYPDSDISGAGWQLYQSQIAIGSGGWLGAGFGEGVQKYKYLPEAIGDSIFAVIAEEFGFVGSFVLLSLYIFLLWRFVHIALNSSDYFARLLGSGIVIIILVQTFVNIGSMVGLIPLTGLPLAFISQGGSSLAVTLFSTGILLNISKYKKV